ncbi:MAG: flippase-like domain-containing protein [Chitinispirillaceae bacterium]|nr:flippase-like domain-containing protein [Chitinispirillaceae bacterium]
MKKSTVLQLCAGIVVTFVGLYIFFSQVKPAQVWSEICGTPVPVIIGVALLSPLSLFFRAVRLRLLLNPSKPAPVKDLFPQVVIGFMANNIFPARLGEALRALLLWKKSGFTLAESVGSLVIERIIDTLFFAAFFFVPVFLSAEMSSLRLYGYIMAVVFVCSCGIALLYRHFPSFIVKSGKWCMHLLPQKVRKPLLNVASEVISNLDWMFSIKKVVAVFILSIAVPACYAVMMWLLGLDIEKFGILGGMFGVAFAALGAAIPLAPGYVGTLHTSVLNGLGLAGVAADRAGAIAVLYHAIGYVTVTALGLYYFFSIRLSFNIFKNVKKDVSGE